MPSDAFQKKTIEQILEEFKVMCRSKSTDELRNLLFRLQSFPLMKDDSQKIKIVENILAERK